MSDWSIILKPKGGETRRIYMQNLGKYEVKGEIKHDKFKFYKKKVNKDSSIGVACSKQPK